MTESQRSRADALRPSPADGQGENGDCDSDATMEAGIDAAFTSEAGCCPAGGKTEGGHYCTPRVFGCDGHANCRQDADMAQIRSVSRPMGRH